MAKKSIGANAFDIEKQAAEKANAQFKLVQGSQR